MDAIAVPLPVVRRFRRGDPVDTQAFRQLNEAWIARFFRMEAKDLEILGNPETAILANGGEIVFADVEGQPVGTCALHYLCAGEYEIAKMGVAETSQGQGIGRIVLNAAIDVARKMGAKRLYIETNSALIPAIALYHSVGFRPVPAERLTPSPYDRADVYLEWFAD